MSTYYRLKNQHREGFETIDDAEAVAGPKLFDVRGADIHAELAYVETILLFTNKV